MNEYEYIKPICQIDGDVYTFIVCGLVFIWNKAGKEVFAVVSRPDDIHRNTLIKIGEAIGQYTALNVVHEYIYACAKSVNTLKDDIS